MVLTIYCVVDSKQHISVQFLTKATWHFQSAYEENLDKLLKNNYYTIDYSLSILIWHCMIQNGNLLLELVKQQKSFPLKQSSGY